MPQQTQGFDLSVPADLKELQEWFAGIITTPIDYNNKIAPVAPSGKLIKDEAKKFISPSPKLKPHERIQIYNQQYWWRLLNALHENFPLLTRLFGHIDFNQTLGFPYLTKYPPSHWSLNLLGEHLEKFIEENYLKNDKELVLDAARIDYAYTRNFFSEKKEPIRLEALSMEELSLVKLKLQPSIHLFEFNYDLFAFRLEMLKEDPDYYLNQEFPLLKKGKFYFILYRNLQNQAVSDTLSPLAYQILKKFQVGTTIDAICEFLETLGEKETEEASLYLQKWFQDWAALELLTLDSQPEYFLRD